MCVVGHVSLYSRKVTQFPDFPGEFIHFPDILSLGYTALNVSELRCGGWAWPYRGLIRRPPAACAASSGWCPSGPCGPPEPSACLWTSHRPPWLHEHTRKRRTLRLSAFDLSAGRWAEGGARAERVSDLCTGTLSGSMTEGWPSSASRGRWSRASCSSRSAHTHKMTH